MSTLEMASLRERASSKCLATRADAVCSDPSSFRNERHHTCDILEVNDYSRNFVENAMKKQCKKTQVETDEESRAGQMYVKIPYVPGIGEQPANILRSKGMRVAHSSGRVRGRLVW